MSDLKEKKSNLSIKSQSKKNSKDSSLKKKNTIECNNNPNNDNDLLENNLEELENKNNSSLITNTINKSNLTDINKINEYKSKILELEKQLEKEKNISKKKSVKSKEILDIHEKIANSQKQIKLYVHKNNKQRAELQSISHEIDQKLQLIDFKAIKKQIIKRNKENSEKKTEKEITDINIKTKNKQLENIMSLIEILENENEELIFKIKKSKNTKNYELMELQKNQENKINELTKEIKIKRFQLKEHDKCEYNKSELLKKIYFIRDELNRNYGKNLEIQKKLNTLEYKQKENEKKLPKNFKKPKIFLNQTNKSIISRKNTLNLNKEIKTENLKNIDIDQITNHKEKKLNKDESSNKLIKSKSEEKNQEQKYNNNNNNESKDSIQNDSKENLDKISEEQSNTLKSISTRNTFRQIVEKEMITIPPNISKIFSENELKAILIGLDKNITKFKTLLRKYNIQYATVDTLAARHRLDLKNKLNKINELDEKIEFLNVKKDENEAEIQLFQKQIENETEKMNICNMKLLKIHNQVENRKKIIERKNQEIKMLKNQLYKIKNFLKNGDIKAIKDEPEIEIQYIDEEEEENNIINGNTYNNFNENHNDNTNINENVNDNSNNNENGNEKYENEKEKENNNENENEFSERKIETPKTEGTAFEEDNENNFDNIIVKNKNMDQIYLKEEHISSNNSSKSSISL